MHKQSIFRPYTVRVLHKLLRISVVLTMLMATTSYAQEGGVLNERTAEEPDPGSWSKEEGVNVTKLFEEATALAKQGRKQAAIQKYKEVLQADEYWEDAYYNVGILSAQIGQVIDCYLYLERYLELKPDGDDAQQVTAQQRQCRQRMGPTGVLRIPRVMPQDALISIEGAPMGEGPVERLELPAGSYTIEAKRADYEPYSEQITVRPGQDNVADITMTAKDLYGSLSVSVDQPDAKVTLDGEEIDWKKSQDSPIKLKVGKYYVKVEADGYYLWHRHVSVYRDATRNLEVSLIDQDTDLEELLHQN